MVRILKKIKNSYLEELPIIKIYGAIYLIGGLIGMIAAILMRDQFSEQARLLFSPENCCNFWPAFLQQALFFGIVFLLGLTAVGIPLLPLYPLYKGFSLGLIVALAILLHGPKGLLVGFPAFFFQNFLYAFLGYFVCYSSARLSLSLFELIRGRGKHSATYRELIHHIYCILPILPAISIGALWEWKVVPIILNFI